MRWLALAGCLALVGELAGSEDAATPAEIDSARTRSVTIDGRPFGPAEAAERIDALRTEIAYHDDLYFRQAAPVISDSTYDQLKRELASLEQAFPGATQMGTGEGGPGDDRTGRFPARRHRARMLSLNKCYTEAELRAFDARLRRQLGRHELEYVVEPKFDGVAISVTYTRGNLAWAVTRGDGETGDDVTGNVRAIRFLPKTLRTATPDGQVNPQPDLVEIRGEIFIAKSEFARLNREREEAGETPFAEPRNLAAGTLKQLDASAVIGRRLEVVFYGLGACEPTAMHPASQQALLQQLRTWGLPTIEAPAVVRGADAMWLAVQTLGRARAGFDFPTDGAVVKLNPAVWQEQIGATRQAPLWAAAYKFAPARVETQIRAITLQVGRTGLITPVAELQPVELGGTTVARATLFNGAEIARRDIRIGDFVMVEKAGEIIPAIASVNRARRTDAIVPYEFPKICPACGSPLAQTPGMTTVRCGNENCPAQVRRRIEFFASPAALGISGLGPALIEKLVAGGLVRDVADLYRLRREDLLGLGTSGERTTDRVVAAIEKSKHAELWRFIHGLGIPRVGEVAARNLALRFGGLEALARAQLGDFRSAGRLRLSPLGENTARAVLDFFAQPAHQATVVELLAHGVRPASSALEPTARRPLAGKTFVLTGALPNLTRAEATELIVAAGGSVATIFSRKTDFVLVGDGAGPKREAGRSGGVTEIGEAELRRMLADN